jgi:hypothetical protein
LAFLLFDIKQEMNSIPSMYKSKKREIDGNFEILGVVRLEVYKCLKNQMKVCKKWDLLAGVGVE